MNRARNAYYIDFEKDEHNKAIANNHVFFEVDLYSHSADANIFNRLSYVWAGSWIQENTIAVGRRFYSEGIFGQYHRNRIITHEVLHLFYGTGNHGAIAKALFGYDGPEFSASDAIDDFLDHGCPRNKKK